jgi:hypothetical protein
MAGVVS